jgi:DNA integrity scanning protein DisA with diadenylate cyclase activity
MFKFMLRILGLEKYEYPENNKPIMINNNQSSPIETQPKAEVKTEFKTQSESKPEEKPEVELKEVEQKIEAKSKPEAKPVTKKEPTATNKTKKENEVLTADVLVETFSGLKSNYAKMLIDAGFDNLTKINNASDKELLSIKGIGKATLQLLRK